MTNTTSSIPHRVIIATTGMTEVVQSLCRNPLIRTAGIIDCRPTPHDCAHYAEQHHIAHCFYNGLEKLKSWISNLNPDLMIIYKMPFLLPEYIYNLPLFGTINIHPSLLPRYRGPNPWFWIYYNMELYSGITIHKINKYADQGDILLQASFPITWGTPLPILQKVVENRAISLLTLLFANWRNIQPRPQEEESDTLYASNHTNIEKLFKITELSGLRLWHILRGFPWVLTKICPETTGIAFQIGKFRTDLDFPSETGHIKHINNETFLACRDGSIEIIL